MTLLNYIIYISLLVLLHILVEVKSLTTITKPSLRLAHTATFINDKLYILGGGNPPFNKKTAPKENFLYLDCSASFNTRELKWTDLSNNDIIPPHVFAAAARAGANNDILFLYGGSDLLSGEPMSLVYAFDTQINTWSVPTVVGDQPSGKLGIIPIVGDNGLIYLYGGALSGYGPYTNDMFILDTINLSWKIANSIDAPKPRAEYGALILPDKNILYMGGLDEGFGVLKLDEVYLYDTKNDTWTTKLTSGAIPSARGAFSSVLGLDKQRVIVFGGLGSTTRDDLVKYDPLCVLDLSSFSWYIPRVSGNDSSVSCAFHRTALVGNYMVVTFGACNVKEDILLLDISDNDEYVWTTKFVPLVPSAFPSSVLTLPISMVLSFKIGSILLTIGSFLFYKWRKNRQEQNKALNYYQVEEKQEMIKN